MEESKKCPYCGEEILASAKKCKHCGEWLDKNIVKGTGNESAPEPEDDENKLSTWIKDIVSTLGIGLVIFLIIFTVPSESKHLSKANEYADEYASLVIKELKRIAAENKNPIYSVSDIIDDDDCLMIEKLCRKEVRDELEYKRHLIYSTGKVDDFRQIGFLGLVFNLTKVNEAEAEEDAVSIWNEIVEQSRKNAASALLGLTELNSALTFLSLFSEDKADDNDNSFFEKPNSEQITLKGNIFESSTGVKMTFSISNDDSVSGVVTFTFEGYEDTPEHVITAKVKGHIQDTTEPGWAKMVLQDEDGEEYIFDPFPKDFDDEIAVQYGTEIIYLKKI